MQRLQELCGWLSITDLEDVRWRNARSLVEAAANEIREQSVEELVQPLRELEHSLKQGELSTAAVDAFLAKVRQVTAADELLPQDEIADYWFNQADALTEEQWCTDNFIKFEDGLATFREGDAGPLKSTVDELEVLVNSSWQSYKSTPILESEVYAETSAGHQLLEEGVKYWLAALAIAKDALRGANVDLEEAAEHAESGNRLLVALELFSAQLARSQ